MAEIAIYQEHRERWIQYDTDTEVLIRFVGKKELTALQRKAGKAARLGGADPRDLANLYLGRAVVKNWRKIGDPGHPGLVVNKEPLPFSEDNRDLLMEHSLQFSAFVNESAIDAQKYLEDEEAEEGEQEAKNA